MSKTGHHNINMPDGRTLIEWLKPIIKDECKFYAVDTPSDAQIAVVIRGLRMHSIMAHASQYDRSELGKPNEVTEFYPIESSIGRYLRDAPLELLESRKEQW